MTICISFAIAIVYVRRVEVEDTNFGTKFDHELENHCRKVSKSISAPRYVFATNLDELIFLVLDVWQSEYAHNIERAVGSEKALWS